MEVVGDETQLRRTLSHELIGHLGFDLWLGHGADATDKRARWKSDKVRKNFRLRMEKYVLPKIGDMRINQVTQKDVLAILVPIWTDNNETARKCRQFMGDIFKWSMAHEYTEFNPAGEAIAGALPAQRQTRNMRAVPWQETPAALETIRGGAMTAAKLALQFVILTAARSGEVRGATWQEIDLETSTWTIPGERMKAGKEHRVPLSGPALAVLEHGYRQAARYNGNVPCPRGGEPG